MNRPITALIAAALLTALVGCGEKNGHKGGVASILASAQAGAESAKGTDTDDAWDEKVQAYITVGNGMRPSYGNATLAQFAEERNAEGAAQVAAGNFKAIRQNNFFTDFHLQELKKAKAMPGKTPELDHAAEAMIALVDQYVPAWNELAEYNEAKRYEDDGGAKGKELLLKYREGLPKLDAAMAAFSAQIDVASKIAGQKSLAKFKAQGKLLEMNTWEALGSAEKVVDLFDEAEDFRNEAKVKEANGHIAAMETSLTGLRTEHEKRKAQKDSLPTIDHYDRIGDYLTKLAGHYREARKDPSKFNDVVADYNNAVDELNGMSR
ncbi:DUF3829 domain-containing protein [Lysobacter terrae]